MAHLKKAVIEVPRASVPKHNMIYSLNPLPPYSAQYSNKPSNLSAAVVAQKVAHSTTDQENLGTSSESWPFFFLLIFLTFRNFSNRESVFKKVPRAVASLCDGKSKTHK